MSHDYDVDVFKETVIRGNDALLKCQIPSFVSDLVSVDGWIDSEGRDIRRSENPAQGNWTRARGKLLVHKF